jgi:ATP-binding cassette, subfamily B, multidrug efflux pump
MLWLSRRFETWIDPFRPRSDLQPPENIWAFLWHYVSQAKLPYIFVLTFAGLTSLFEALFFFYMGRLIDVLESSNAADGWQGLIANHGHELVLMLVVVIIGRFVAPALAALVEEQTIGRGFSSMVRW